MVILPYVNIPPNITMDAPAPAPIDPKAPAIPAKVRSAALMQMKLLVNSASKAIALDGKYPAGRGELNGLLYPLFDAICQGFQAEPGGRDKVSGCHIVGLYSSIGL